MGEAVKVAIIGGGISGLIAAQVLENYGIAPTIYEKSTSVGGRVKTDLMDGYQLDHGFQVLLDAYPMAQKYLNYNDLSLQKCLSGANIYKNGKKSTLGDPLRDILFLWPTLTSGIGTIKDKWKIFQLNLQLKKKTIEAIFEEPATTTMQYLKNFGFSEGIINDFFKPFFTGIFLEEALETPSSMFQFVFKMFGSGYATLPKAGIGAIPAQLANNLKNTEICFNTQVQNCKENTIQFEDGTTAHADFIIIATESAAVVSNLRNQAIDWKSCQTLYFTMPKSASERPLIGLVANPNTLINNIFVHTTLATESVGKEDLLSVTVVKKHQLSEYELLAKVKMELKSECAIDNVTYLKTYTIKKALPKLNAITNTISPTETRLTDTLFLAGDYLVNGSLNAAMHSGENAAMGVIEVLGGRNLV